MAEMSQIDFEATKCILETKTNWKEKTALFMQQLNIIFFSKKNFKKIVGFFFICSATYICFNGVTFNSGLIGMSSLQLDVIFLAGVESLCYVICYFLISRFSRKKMVFYCMLIILIGSIT